jgi:hypothetical protein
MRAQENFGVIVCYDEALGKIGVEILFEVEVATYDYKKDKFKLSGVPKYSRTSCGKLGNI